MGSDGKPQRRTRPALSVEASEMQLISLATDLARKQLEEGTASSQVISLFLKLGTTNARLEREILEKQARLMEAKTENLRSAKRIEALYEEALTAFRRYQGSGDETDY